MAGRANLASPWPPPAAEKQPEAHGHCLRERAPNALGVDSNRRIQDVLRKDERVEADALE